eukprot:5173756-Amphidinium_carterae.1
MQKAPSRRSFSWLRGCKSALCDQREWNLGRAVSGWFWVWTTAEQSKTIKKRAMKTEVLATAGSGLPPATMFETTSWHARSRSFPRGLQTAAIFASRRQFRS